MEKQEDQEQDNIKICYTIEDKNKVIDQLNVKWRWATEEERTRKAQLHWLAGLCNWDIINNCINQLKNKIKKRN